MFKKKENLWLYFLKNVYIIVGIVLIWRGIWYVMDGLDKIFFGGSHLWTSFLGVILGFALLYLPDRDLKEIERL